MKTRTWEIPEPDQRLLIEQSVTDAIRHAKTGWVVRLMSQSKTDKQRSFFHCLCADIGKELGYTPSEIKQMIKQWHYGFDEKKIGNNWYRVLRSTEEDDKEQYSELIEAAQRWAAENGIVAK